jgi:hypothetical protein
MQKVGQVPAIDAQKKSGKNSLRPQYSIVMRLGSLNVPSPSPLRSQMYMTFLLLVKDHAKRVRFVAQILPASFVVDTTGWKVIKASNHEVKKAVPCNL